MVHEHIVRLHDDEGGGGVQPQRSCEKRGRDSNGGWACVKAKQRRQCAVSVGALSRQVTQATSTAHSYLNKGGCRGGDGGCPTESTPTRRVAENAQSGLANGNDRAHVGPISDGHLAAGLRGAWQLQTRRGPGQCVAARALLLLRRRWHAILAHNIATVALHTQRILTNCVAPLTHWAARGTWVAHGTCSFACTAARRRTHHSSTQQMPSLGSARCSGDRAAAPPSNVAALSAHTRLLLWNQPCARATAKAPDASSRMLQRW